VPVVPPTDPLPPAGSPDPAQASVASSRRGRARKAGDGVRRFVWAALLLALVAVVAAEGAAWVEAERFRGTLDVLDGLHLADTQSEYDGILRRSVLDLGVRMRVNRLLTNRLTAFADSVIADYRREEPTMSPAAWRQAVEALQWAARLSRPDDELLANQLTCEAHVIRLAARNQPTLTARQTFNRAIDKFRAAADKDPHSFDPYLGISRIAVYGLTDVDQAAAAIEEARSRGYVAGRRERALLGDGYLRRANSSRTLARTLSGEQRRRELERARHDYAGCIEAFDAIIGFGYAAKNLETCKRQLERVEHELTAAASDGSPGS
jgi:hypothetical protein